MIVLPCIYDSDGQIILRPLPEPITIDLRAATLHRSRGRLATLPGVAPEGHEPSGVRVVVKP